MFPFVLLDEIFADKLDSRQIRPPIYSLKQSKLRRRRTIRYAILYFALFILFIVLIVAPMIAGKFLKNLKVDTLPINLMQPTNLKNNDTTDQTTGTILGTAAATAAASGDSAASSAAARRFAHFMY